MKIDGAIFDIDGTILDSMPIWSTFGEDYLKAKNIFTKEDLHEKFKTMTLIQSAEYFKDNYGITDSVEDILKDFDKSVEDFYFYEAELKDGMKDVLEKLKSKGVKMCIATATDRYLIEAALKRNDVLKYFDKIFTCTEEQNDKNTPAIFEKSLKFLSTCKEYTYVFEDALHAIKTAKNAGFKVIGIYDESAKDNQKEIKDICDVYVTSYTDWVRKL